MPLIETYAPVITPTAFRDYAVKHYFSPSLRAPFLWGPPGVGKSASVYEAAIEIANALSSAAYYGVKIALTASSAGKPVERVLLDYGAALFRSYPIKNATYDFIFANAEVHKVSDVANNGKLDALNGLYDKASYYVKRKALALKENLMRLTSLVLSYPSVREIVREAKTTAPLVLMNDEVELLEYPCFAVVARRIPEGWKCIQKNGECRRAVTPGGCIAFRHDDEEFRNFVLRQTARLGTSSDVLAYIDSLAQRAADGTPVFAGYFLHYVDVRLGQLELDDIKGLPSDVLARIRALEYGENALKGARVLWLQPPWLVRHGFGITFFDELNQAREYIQAAAYQIILDRRVSTGAELSPLVMTVAAGNQPDFAPGVAKMLAPPLRNRFAPTFHMAPSVPVDFPMDEIIARLHKMAYGETGAGSFVDYLRSLGVSWVDDLATWMIDAYDYMAKAMKGSPNIRKLIVVTPRSQEFLVENVGMPPAEFAKITSEYVRSQSRTIHPALWLAYTVFGIMGEDETPMSTAVASKGSPGYYSFMFLMRYGIYVSLLPVVRALFEKDFKERLNEIKHSLVIARLLGIGAAESIRDLLTMASGHEVEGILMGTDKDVLNLVNNVREYLPSDIKDKCAAADYNCMAALASVEPSVLAADVAKNMAESLLPCSEAKALVGSTKPDAEFCKPDNPEN
ncbi:MAG: hypothetical protein ACP5I3_11240, partial [Thermoproteus sp.]